jgi:hypothetical protein
MADDLLQHEGRNRLKFIQAALPLMPLHRGHELISARGKERGDSLFFILLFSIHLKVIVKIVEGIAVLGVSVAD